MYYGDIASAYVSKIVSVKTSEVKKITCTSLLTQSKIGAAADPDPIAKTTPIPTTTSESNKPQFNECSEKERGAVTTSGSPPEPSSSGMITVPRSRAPPIPTDAQNLAPLPQHSRSKSPVHSTASRHVPSKQYKKPAPLPDETRWKPSTSNASDNAAFQHENGNVKTNMKMEKKRVMPLPPIEPPEYGNFKMTVVDEPIFGKEGPIPVKLDPIYGNFGESESSHDPIYGNF
ncbi:hypothetical protein B566_EDAN004934 [Ephemera danica]|nr:hypothetical protein B566_EDAN004934 [Ephemera danica]